MYVISLMGVSKVIEAPVHQIKKWIQLFGSYIPMTFMDQILYFEIEAVHILSFIKEKIEEEYDWTEIESLLEHTVFGE
ncbi:MULTISPECIES: hypothetical protein [Oceanobacillus]|uniref:Uncharacterized protein n=1 Tax=Oceanobacillus kimchii TaxID=746691 RepID=A0ABQ5TLA9_9BACI|nr:MULTISPECIES: hypothetical protein [Oceanobacillus]MBT2600734.1 hypothetical protein [Oceanobacillus sp. ISL-74]MBT2650869.1 hypothetical protein [Oceanobacillus sp. ISL-73]MCT1575489.1 hypothetical protein [Oceanobacillus kimchii]MCT2138062.1 hypothetical protein [Oceanobacillus kimchii]OEH55306.1 hypothetical protein AQ616_03795 [Oceanobacillus sp. E9]